MYFGFPPPSTGLVTSATKADPVISRQAPKHVVAVKSDEDIIAWCSDKVVVPIGADDRRSLTATRRSHSKPKHVVVGSEVTYPEIDKLIAAANQQQATHPRRASDAWATIDRKLVDAAATIPYGNSVNHYFVSERVGNTLIHPVTGPLIAQMWVQ